MALQPETQRRIGTEAVTWRWGRLEEFGHNVLNGIPSRRFYIPQI
jgi:hypothetical protein